MPPPTSNAADAVRTLRRVIGTSVISRNVMTISGPGSRPASQGRRRRCRCVARSSRRVPNTGSRPAKIQFGVSGNRAGMLAGSPWTGSSGSLARVMIAVLRECPPEPCGRCAVAGLETRREVALAGEAALRSDLGDRQVRHSQQLARPRQATLLDVLAGRRTASLDEHVTEIGFHPGAWRASAALVISSPRCLSIHASTARILPELGT